jgi:hypothetical protein
VAKPGRRPVLDEMKQREILAIVSVGCSRRTAARYVGCSVSTIQNTAERDEKFADKLLQAESKAVVKLMKNINEAAKKAQYWRAAAWALERLNPEEYASPHPDVITTEQISQLMSHFSQIVVEEVPVDAYCKKIIKRLGDLGKMISAIAPRKHDATIENAQNKNEKTIKTNK